MATHKRVWLITGTSSGLGHEIARAALAHGDIVVATARDPGKLADLAAAGAITEQLDVTAPDTTLSATITRIVQRTGTIDILVNNAGYILAGAVEEASRDEAQDQFATNVFGQLNVSRAVLPHMRRQRSGVIANLGSMTGWQGGPAVGLYCASKACAGILSEALRAEVAHLGITVTAVEPGAFRTDFLAQGHKVRAATHISELDQGTSGTHDVLAAYNQRQPGDPVKAARLIVEGLTGTGRCEGREPPARWVIGSDAHQFVTAALDQQRKVMDEWKDLTTATDCDI
ncbi:hypothetical protein F5144DRAFT_479358 [Chaetomium tenue]|uniref:Uncharacterized protein n=1 Tax=Chaetomium tenue TaxID=1854479 RepID=A0ACB7PKA5_9PEZI|nr:hypothetical protein F5144DRAFT_479358 [Chaetomium globosum]